MKLDVCIYIFMSMRLRTKLFFIHRYLDDIKREVNQSQNFLKIIDFALICSRISYLLSPSHKLVTQGT